MKLAVIIPAYNEERRIERTLREYSGYLDNFVKKKNNFDYEILIVINNTKDRTEEIVRNCKKNNKKISCLNLKEAGKGNAIIVGFKNALERGFNLIGFVDADMSTKPEEYYKLVNYSKNYDGIMASRYLGQSVVKPKQPVKRRVVSRIGNFIIRTLFFFPYRDTQCGAKVFKREALEKIISLLGITNWAFDVDLIYQLRKAKMRIKELPTVWEDSPDSTLNIKKASTQFFLAIIQLRILNSPFGKITKIFRPIVNGLWRKIK